MRPAINLQSLLILLMFVQLTSLSGINRNLCGQTDTDSTLIAYRSDSAQEKDPATKWEKDIARFEKLDRADPPRKEGVLFLGSSSIRKWDLKKWFPDLNCLNRGFGGSQLSDSIYYFDRVVVPYQPKIIVLYAGDNDISKGKTPDQVAKDFRDFVQQVKKSLPQTKVVFIAIKPSLSRWKLVGKMREANRMIQDFASRDENIEFADIDRPMIGEDKKPKRELFLSDGLHLNQTGYQIWYESIRPLLK